MSVRLWGYGVWGVCDAKDPMMNVFDLLDRLGRIDWEPFWGNVINWEPFWGNVINWEPFWGNGINWEPFWGNGINWEPF